MTLHLLATAAALGSGLVAGVFFAFSTFVMKALARQPPPQGIATMQAINITVVNPWFMAAFIGTAVASAILAVAGSGNPWLAAGAALYVIGCFGVTIALNVPLNNRLARAEAGSTEAAALWHHYLSRWTLWNHLRTVSAAAATVAFMLA